MDYQTGFFYLFAAVLLFAAFRVITARNPVHAVLFLMLAFSQASALWLLLKAEFLGITLVLVYLGAVMVLFLFVVMMLDIDFTELRAGAAKYAPIGALIGLIVAVELVVVIGGSTISPEALNAITQPIPAVAERQNTQALGDVLYTDYVFFFQIAGLVLFVAMIGAIVLAMRHRAIIKRKDICAQVARTPETAVKVVKVKPGQGV